jgi:phosphoribosyl 1,2-cyclic phosphodiesterase
MQLCTLASGSSGNCLLISHGKTHILVDAGISARRISCGLDRLGLAPEQLSAVLITHEHSDHIGGLAVLVKRRRIPSGKRGTGSISRGKYPQSGTCYIPSPGGRFSVDDMEISSFQTPHDAAESVGLLSEAGRSGLPWPPIRVRSGTGALRGLRPDLLVLESNHDVDRLKTGSYPYFLKKPSWAIADICATRRHQTRVCLRPNRNPPDPFGAPERENNTPQLARAAVANALSGIGALDGRDVLLCVAPREENSPVFAL